MIRKTKGNRMLAQSLISSVVPPNESISINLRYDPFHEGNAVRKPAVTGKERSWLLRHGKADRSLLQQAVDFDFTSGAEVDAAVDYDRDDEAGGQGRAVALAVLFGLVDRLAEFGCVEGIEDGVFGIGSVPGFGGDGPDDSIPVAVGGNGRGCGGIDELRA